MRFLCLLLVTCLCLMSLPAALQSATNDQPVVADAVAVAPAPPEVNVSHKSDKERVIAAPPAPAEAVPPPPAIAMVTTRSSLPVASASLRRPMAKPVVHRSNEEICSTLKTAAQTNALPMPFFIRLLFQESGFDAGAVSPVGAQGIAQFMPDTAADMGLDNPFDPLQAIPASARLLRNLVAQFGNLGLAAAAYNAGPKRVQDWLATKNGKLPQETEAYVKAITGKAPKNWRHAMAMQAETRIPAGALCRDQVLPRILTAAGHKIVRRLIAARARLRALHAQRALAAIKHSPKPMRLVRQAHL